MGDRRNGEGRAFQFTALATELDKAAVYVQAQLRKIGVVMDIQSNELQGLRDRIRAGRFQAAFSSVYSNYSNGSYGHASMFGTDSPMGPPDPRIAELLDQAQCTVDPAQVDEDYRRLAPLFMADMPATVLYPAVHTSVVHRRVRGLSSPWRAEPVWYLEDLWLEEND